MDPIRAIVSGDGSRLVLGSGERARLRDLAGKSVVIKPHRETRSAKANAYYWSTVLKMLSDECGQSEDDVHDSMCVMFLPSEQKRVTFFNKMTGESLPVDTDHRRSSGLSGAKFYDFVERVRVWGAEFLGVITPDPDPEYWRKRDSVEVSA